MSGFKWDPNVAEVERSTYHYWRWVAHALCGHIDTGHEPEWLGEANLCPACKSILANEGWTEADFAADKPVGRGAL